ncbi:DUF5701 family protein [uncultured Phycicoccus sp.]|uniref:DUF5701 family protein n=1 Tax=uncultured Phycicoccus sp. TaxID=661422 RepID=UPI002637F060|nr:DUF5701 family protein [uncultured Phycicoccus sp.]
MGRPIDTRRSAITDPDVTRSARAELDRQVTTLLRLGYPALAAQTESAFLRRLAPLREVADGLGGLAPGRPGSVPLVLVVTGAVVDPQHTVPLLRLAPAGTRPGIVDRNHGEEGLAPYRPIPQVELPHPDAYLLLDVDRGEEFRGVRPEEALPVVLGRGRTPLTIEDGVAVVTHAPHLLAKNACFMLSGSRRGDRRVPAMWISAGAPKLGWCWDGNPHDWLGVASAGSRVAAGSGTHT